MFIELVTFFIGFWFNIFQIFIGMKSGDLGVEYYAEIHTSMLNSFVHSMCMPFTCYGFLYSIPSFLYLNKKQANILQTCLYMFYIGHYITIDFWTTVVFAIVYSIPLLEARKRYRQSIITIGKGLLISATSLLIQEYFGHYHGGDDASRFEAVPNAIIYANYFAANKLIH